MDSRQLSVCWALPRMHLSLAILNAAINRHGHACPCQTITGFPISIACASDTATHDNLVTPEVGAHHLSATACTAQLGALSFVQELTAQETASQEEGKQLQGSAPGSPGNRVRVRGR